MIVGKVGGVGHGKTMRAVVDAVELARIRGAVLASNIAITAPGLPAGFVQLAMSSSGLDGLDELVADARREGRGLVLVVDEVHMIWGAREWSEMTKVTRYRLTQSRKLGVDVIWTAQFTDQVEKNVRELTDSVEFLRAWPAPTITRRESGKRPLFFLASTYRPGTEGNVKKRLGRSWYRYRRQHETWYDTDELVLPLEPVKDRPQGDRRSRRAASLTGGGARQPRPLRDPDEGGAPIHDGGPARRGQTAQGGILVPADTIRLASGGT